MSKTELTKPLLVMLYGYPGAGKTYFARQLCESMNAVHIHGDRIRFELFEQPRNDKQENEVIAHLMEYMTEEFLRAGVSVVYDGNAFRASQRRVLRDIARKGKVQFLLIWLQIDADSAMARLTNRDRRKSDDKYALPYTKETFMDFAKHMQNPKDEDYIVISGKHTFNTQRAAVMKKLYDLGLINSDSATANVIKPGLVNLIPHANGGRVDLSRRNIVIR